MLIPFLNLFSTGPLALDRIEHVVDDSFDCLCVYDLWIVVKDFLSHRITQRPIPFTGSLLGVLLHHLLQNCATLIKVTGLLGGRRCLGGTFLMTIRVVASVLQCFYTA